MRDGDKQCASGTISYYGEAFYVDGVTAYKFGGKNVGNVSTAPPGFGIDVNGPAGGLAFVLDSEEGMMAVKNLIKSGTGVSGYVRHNIDVKWDEKNKETKGRTEILGTRIN